MAKTKKTTIDSDGMTCAACSSRIEKKVNILDDVNAQVNLTTEKETVEYNNEKHEVQEFINTIK
ncbi:cation transporter, partial [Staphylococcus aureus]